jgi:hypothetical protein
MLFAVVVLGVSLQVIGTVSAWQQGPAAKPPATETSEKDKCTLSGFVTNIQTGEPIKKANLRMTLSNVARTTNGVFEQTGYSGKSTADGSFTFEGMAPGEYWLIAEKSGFIRTRYGSKNGLNGGTMLSLSPGQKIAGIKFQLVPQATITGRVLDDDGDPIGGVVVQALGRMWMQGGKAHYAPIGRATTDDTGVYRITNLSPGKYYIMAEDPRQQRMNSMNEKPATPGKPNIQPVRTFYPSSLDLTGAAKLELKAGQEQPGTDIRIRSAETFHIRGKVTGDVSEDPNQPTMLMLVPYNNDSIKITLFQGFTMLRKDHTFEIGNVLPGAYVISMPGMNGEKQTARQPVEVGSADLNDVVIASQPTFTIHGQIELQGTGSSDAKQKGLDGVYVTLQPDDMDMMFGNTQGIAKPDGSFVIENLPASKLRANVFNEPEGTYVKSIRLGNQETLGKPLDLNGSGELHVLLHTGAPELCGTVTAKKGGSVVPVSSASVLLISEDLIRSGGSPHTANTNQNGAFTAKGLTPGVYYALAYESEERRNMQDPTLLKLLAGKATKVELKENDKQQVQLTLLPAEDLQATLVAAGDDN